MTPWHGTTNGKKIWVGLFEIWKNRFFIDGGIRDLVLIALIAEIENCFYKLDIFFRIFMPLTYAF